MTVGTHALWWRRVVARAVDAALLSPVVLWVLWRFANLPEMGLEGVAVVLGLFLVGLLWATVGWAAYDTWAVSRWAATPGKRLMGIEVRATDGTLTTGRQALLRSLRSTVPAVLVGAVLYAMTAGGSPIVFVVLPVWWTVQTARGDGRTGYDRAAGTVVVSRGVPVQPSADVEAPLDETETGRRLRRTVVTPTAALTVLGVQAWARAEPQRLVPALVLLAAAAAAVWWAWSQTARRGQVTAVVFACCALLTASLVADLRHSDIAIGQRLGAELVVRGFRPVAAGERVALCHLGWPEADCPVAKDGPDWRLHGTFEEALARVADAATAAGMTVDVFGGMGNESGERTLLVRSGGRFLMVYVSDDRPSSSVVPPGQVAVYWTLR